MNEISVNESLVKKLARKIVAIENENLKTEELNTSEIVEKIRKEIEEKVKIEEKI